MTRTSSTPSFADSAMSFEQWMRRPVYVTQCKTFSMAKSICNVELKPHEGLAMRMDRIDDGLATFRSLPQYRSQAARALRNKVAQAVRNERKARLINSTTRKDQS